jgi:pimeloyl-ACP methyl ester carboxylesterase
LRSSSSGAGVPTASPSAGAATPPSPAQRYAEIEFGADGGPTLRRRVWSDGRIGVVLAHGFSQGLAQDAWDEFAEYLAERIFIVAASMGGLAAFRAADEAEVDLAGIVSLATPQFPSIYYNGEPPENDVTPERLQRIAAPKLFIAGADDVQLPGQAPLKPGVESVRFAEDARAMFEASPEPRQLEIVDSARHSSDLLIGADPEVVEHTRELIVAFIEEHA